jgi:hypothetical protein
MKRSVMSAVLAAAWSVAVAAQTGGTMDKSQRMDKMPTQVTYIGCLEAGSAAGTFTLTHADRMGNDAMKKDAMAKGAMSHDMMASTRLHLASSSVDLSKNVGRKVSVTGSASAMHKDEAGMNASTFTVKTLKRVAASCS